MLGGGHCFFTPNTTANSCRTDDLDVVALAEDLGYTFFRDRKTFDSAPLKLPYIGLFTEDHMSYEIDRNATQEPSLSEMAIKGLNDLNAASGKQGFFVLVEASRIDHAGHSNDPVGHLHDILAYNEAMKAMREWVDEHAEDSPTILISTADHECGGLTVGVDIDGAPEYWFEPQHFVNAKATPGPLATLWKAYNGTDQKAFLKENVFGRYGIEAPTVEEYEQAIELKSDTSDFALFLAHALSARLGVNWASLGHTASDVTLYGWGVNAGKFAGNRENTEVGQFIAQQLGLDLESVQRKLRSNTTWMKEWVMPETVDRKLARRRSLARHHN
jgi:alkaline phosphatase